VKFSSIRFPWLALVGLALITTTVITNSAPVSARQPADAVLVGAGDIASCGLTGDSETAQLLENIPGTVFTAGDNAYEDGSATNFKSCYAPTWGRVLSRTRPAPGNHDYNTPGAAPYYAYFGARAGEPGKGYYSYELGTWHVVVLNSNIDADAKSPQIAWLEADLKAHETACTAAIWHHPRFSSGVHGSDARFQSFWETLYTAGVDVVLNGHDHDYERFAPQTPDGKGDAKKGIREFVVGTGGASLRPFLLPRANSELRNSSTWGVLKLTLRANGYTWNFVPVAGQKFSDAGTGACH
jgi:acid phosphatase type 7